MLQGHFRERVDEILQSHGDFGTRGSPVAFVISEIQPFEEKNMPEVNVSFLDVGAKFIRQPEK